MAPRNRKRRNPEQTGRNAEMTGTENEQTRSLVVGGVVGAVGAAIGSNSIRRMCVVPHVVVVGPVAIIAVVLVAVVVVVAVVAAAAEAVVRSMKMVERPSG